MAEGGQEDLGNQANDKRQMMQPGKRQRHETSIYCGFCWKDTESVLAECQGCKLNFCLKCSGLTEGTFVLFAEGKLEGFLWTCRSCTNTLPSLRSITDTLQEIKQLHDTRMGNLESKVDKMETEITEKVTASMKDVKTEITQEIKSSVRQLVDERNKEMDDRRRRETNLIFFNIPEQLTQIVEDENKQDEADMRTFCRELGLEDIDINVIYRLGKKVPTRTRPIKVVFGNRLHRKFLLDNAKYIRQKVTARLIKTIIVKDLTVEQRNDRKQKRLARPGEAMNIVEAVAEKPPSPTAPDIRPSRLATGIGAHSTPRRPQHLNMRTASQAHVLDETMQDDITVIGGILTQQTINQPVLDETMQEAVIGGILTQSNINLPVSPEVERH